MHLIEHRTIYYITEHCRFVLYVLKKILEFIKNTISNPCRMIFFLASSENSTNISTKSLRQLKFQMEIIIIGSFFFSATLTENCQTFLWNHIHFNTVINECLRVFRKKKKKKKL